MPAFKDRTGESKLMNCGYVATIIEYKSHDDVLVRFNDENQTEKRTKYHYFKTGAVNNCSRSEFLKKHNNEVSSKCKEEYIGKEFTATNGQKFKIIDYINTYKITVQFEDGTIVKNKFYGNIKNGEITNPNYTPQEYKIDTYKNSRIGQQMTNKYGETVTIIDYKNYHNVTVQFDNGETKKTSIKFFDENKVYSSKALANSKIGQTNICTNGQKITIVEYRGANDLVVEFEDGYRKKTCYKLFLQGFVRHGTLNNLHTKWKTNCGLECEVIEYNKKEDVTVQFEDGTILNKQNMSRVRAGMVAHPILKNPTGTYNNLDFKRFTRTPNGTYYICTCPACSFTGLLTPRQMLTHRC